MPVNLCASSSVHVRAFARTAKEAPAAVPGFVSVMRRSGDTTKETHDMIPNCEIMTVMMGTAGMVRAIRLGRTLSSALMKGGSDESENTHYDGGRLYDSGVVSGSAPTPASTAMARVRWHIKNVSTMIRWRFIISPTVRVRRVAIATVPVMRVVARCVYHRWSMRMVGVMGTLRGDVVAHC
jgi:hypothetical protein